MLSMRRIHRLSSYTTQQFAIQIPVIGLGIPAAIASALVLCGLALYFLVGTPPLEMANNFVLSLAVPLSKAIAALASIGLLFALIAALSYWCIAWMRPTRSMPDVQVRVCRIGLPTALQWVITPASVCRNGHAILAQALHFDSSSRVVTSTPSGLCGASPLLI